MKRDIKFRALDGEKMIFRGLHDRNWYTDEKSGKAVKGTHPSDTHHLTVMQFTGLYDKNGKEIYEGDRLSTPKGVCTVTYEFGCFYAITVSRYRLGGWNADCIEVIGNIHETPGKA